MQKLEAINDIENNLNLETANPIDDLFKKLNA